jgi:hypothetical protein
MYLPSAQTPWPCIFTTYCVGCGGRGAGETEGDPHPLHHALPLHCLNMQVIRARIFKRLWSPGIDSKELIPTAFVAWRAGMITLFPFGS